MSRPNEDDPAAGDADAAAALVRELHEHLVSALVAKFGDELQVREAYDPENGLVSYRFEIHGAHCTAVIAPHTGQIAVMSLDARLGRVRRGYLKALRWLGQNRAFNTLAIAYGEEAAQARDLWVAADRNTRSGDVAGMRCELDDFCLEVGKAITGLKLWFPQFVDGATLLDLEADAVDDEKVRDALAAPRATLQAMEDSEEAMDNSAVLYCYVTRWLGEWEKNLAMLNSEPIRQLAADDPAMAPQIAGARLRATIALGRYREALAEALPQVDDSEISLSRRAALQAECLCELGQPEEALDTLLSAELDDDAWVHFIRSCACMKLGRQEEAAQHFSNYEAMIGPDSLGRKKIAALAGDDDEAG
jgi:hypothetical protein